MAKTVLVIDDDASVRDAFELILDDLGYQVRLAEDGLKGVDSVKEMRPDLIFLDLKMPNMNGIEVLHKLHELDDSLKIYVVTAFAREFTLQLEEAVAAGCKFELAAKPLGAEQIGIITQAALGK